MKYNNKYREKFSFSYLDEKTSLQLPKYCEWKNCNNKGKYKAPKNREFLREFYWFCLEHVRQYNNKWDYFANCTIEEIEAELKSDLTWHRPSWPIGINNTNFIINDNIHNFFNNDKFTSNNELKISKKELKMADFYEILGLELDSSLPEIKRRYKTLVKKLHPDRNQNDKNSSDKLIRINEAYENLIKHLT